MGDFPPITLLILFLSVILFLKGRADYLAYLSFISLIFSRAFLDPFSTRIRPDQIVLLFFMVLIFLNMIIIKSNIQFSKKYDKPLIFALYLFPVSILANHLAVGLLVYPTNKIAFGSTVQSYINTLVELEPTFALVTQNLYVIFPILAYYCLRKLNVEILEKCINYFIYAVAFLTLWNLCNIIELTILNGSFFTNITNILVGREGAFGSTSGLGIIRVGGFVGEPSMYAYITLPAFGYVMGKAITDKKHNKKWYILAFLFLFGLIVSFSTSGFASVILFMFIYSLYNFRKKEYIYFTIFMIAIIVTGSFIFSEYLNAFIQYNMGKISLGQGSFAIRIWSVKHNLILLSKHPFLGIGIGSGGALGGMVTVLSNIGIIGALFLIYSFRTVFPIREKGVLFSFYALIIFNVITGDLSTFFSPIFALLLAYSSKILHFNQCKNKQSIIVC